MGILFKNAAILTLGTTAAQGISFLITPFIARFYTAQDAGLFSVYLSTVNILTQGACFKYEMALVNCAGDEERKDINKVCAVFLMVTAAVSSIVGAAIGKYILHQSEINTVGYSLLLAVGVGAVGWFHVLSNNCIFEKRYKELAYANLIKAAVCAGLQLALYPWGGWGMITAQGGGYIFACLVLKQKFSKSNRDIEKKKRKDKDLFILEKRVRKAMIKYKAYPLYTMPGSVANTATLGQISFWGSRMYSTQELGEYAMMDRILSLPLLLTSNAVGQVFFKQAAEEYQSKGRISSFPTVWVTLIGLSIVGFTGLYFLLPQVISLFLGPQWSNCIYYRDSLLPLYGVRFACTPLLFSAIVMRKQREMMLWQVGTLVITAMVFYKTAGKTLPFEDFLRHGLWATAGAYVFFTAICCIWALRQ